MGLSEVDKKRELTERQLENLKKGREKLARLRKRAKKEGKPLKRKKVWRKQD